MRKNTLLLAGKTLERLKVLAAQMDRSLEETVAFLLDHFDSALERDFEMKFGRLGGRAYLRDQTCQSSFRNSVVFIGHNDH